MSNADVQIVVSLRDSASKNLLQQLGLINSETGKIDTSAAKAGSALERMGASSKQGGAALKGMSGELNNMSSKALTVGERLNTGFKSALGTAKQIGTVLSQGVAGWETMKAVGGAIIKPTVDYESQLANMTNTAFAGKSTQEKETGLTELHSAIKGAIAKSGGTREQGVDALDKILASGVFNAGDKGVQERAKGSGLSAEAQARKEAVSILPAVLAGAKAANARPDEVASFVLKGIQQGYFKPEEAGSAIDKALVAAQAGGFEFKDMAKNLGAQLAIGKQSGLNGMGGYERILAMNQAAFTAAGSGDEAANNVTNLLAKLNSEDTKKDFKKQAGIDLDSELKKGATKGEDSLQVVIRLLSQQLAGNKDYQNAQSQLKNARENKDADGVTKALTAIQAIAQGTTVGKFFQDRQALTGLIPVLDPTYMNSIMAQTSQADGATKNNIDFLQNQTAWKMEQGKNTADNARFDAQRGVVGDVVGGANEAFTQLGAEFPALTGALVSLKDATILAASVYGAVSLTGMLGKGGGLGGLLGKTAGVGVGAAGAAGWLSKAGGLAKGAGVVGAVGMAAWNAGGNAMTLMNDKAGAREKTEAKGGLVGAGVGAVVGGVVGSIVPVLGTALGAAAGAWLGGKAGEWVGGKVSDAPPLAAAPAMQNQQGVAQTQALIQSNAQLQQVNAQITALNQISNNAPLEAQMTAVAGSVQALANKPSPVTNFTSNLVVDGAVVATMVNRYNGNQAQRG